MCRKTSNNNLQKHNNRKHSKSGFTLVELSVVMALLAIVGTMIVSFSVFMGGFVSNNKAEYRFLEEHAALKEELTLWVAENDTPDSVFSIGISGNLIIQANGRQKNVSFMNGVLSLDTEQIPDFETIDLVSFTANDKLIKCTTHHFDDGGKLTAELCFVFSLRSAEISVQEGYENE